MSLAGTFGKRTKDPFALANGHVFVVKSPQRTLRVLAFNDVEARMGMRDYTEKTHRNSTPPEDLMLEAFSIVETLPSSEWYALDCIGPNQGWAK